MDGWYEISQSFDGQFRFVLKAGNAQTLLTSELFESQISAENGIRAVQASCGVDDNYHRKITSNGKFFFNLKSSANKVLGSSQMYATEHLRESGVVAVKSVGATFDVKDKTGSEAVQISIDASRNSVLHIPDPLVMHIEIGQAKASDLAELFHEISILYQMVGGSGVTFYYERTKEKIEVEA